MNEKEIAFANLARKLTQEDPATTRLLDIAGRIFQLRASPEDGSLGATAEPFGIKQSTLIVVPENADVELHRSVDAFARVRTVADHVSQAIDGLHVLICCVSENRFQRFEITVDIAQNCPFHPMTPNRL